MLSWLRKHPSDEKNKEIGQSPLLATSVESLKLLVIAPQESRSQRYVEAIENYLRSSRSEEEATERIYASSKSFSQHQRESIENVIAELDRSLRTMLGTLDSALSSGDKIAVGVGQSSRRLSSLSEIRTFEELRQKVSEEAAGLASAISEYRQSIHAVHERYRKELETMRATLDVAQMAAKVDSLTNLPNRTCHEYHVTAALEEACKGKKQALAIIDLNCFKEINDTYGHLAGDAALVCFTRAISQFLGREAFVARLGGDEFTVVVKGSASQLEARLEEFRKKMAETKFDLGPAKSEIFISYGVVDLLSGCSYRTLMKEADEKMYAHKRSLKLGRAA